MRPPRLVSGELLLGLLLPPECLSVIDDGPPRVLVVGGLALVLSRWTMEVSGPDGERLRRSGTATDVLRRQPDGRWRYVIDNSAGVDIPAGTIAPG